MAVVAMNGNVVALKQDAKFEEFWSLYPAPRRQSKAVCKSKWDKITGPNGLYTRAQDRDSGTYEFITLSATPEQIIAGLKRCRELWTDKNTYGWKEAAKFVPLVGTWLNQGRWMDLDA